ncbi:polysialyltransferase family glycosyltransferase [uncultured Roseibium sp.]|uniref:polysialyltransferase family glycosyltransferase n=1 Tax=uncultured Roseibium sp. TaxID=1936171 RepID=UPI002625D12B|nr:polysialyltransferase family glycosyltransferase [uncultured Roseibium sp.]
MMLICEVSTKFGLLNLISTLEADAAFKSHTEKVLLVSEHNTNPEIEHQLWDYVKANKEPLTKYFTNFYFLNELIAPLHPHKWTSPGSDIQRFSYRNVFSRSIGVRSKDKIELLVESIQIPPAKTLCELFSRENIFIYSDGLMTFGPTRNRLPANIGSRIKKVFYLDLIPGLKPNLLREFGVTTTALNCDRLLELINSISQLRLSKDSSKNFDGCPVVLGQYISGLGLCTNEEEIDLYFQAIKKSFELGGRKRVFFKPHPTFSSGLLHRLEAKLNKQAIEFSFLNSLHIFEELLLHSKPLFIVSVFSTGLATANRLFGIPCYSFRTEYFLDKLTPYENSNRIPAALIGMVFDDIETGRTTSKQQTLQTAIDVIAASMQPEILAPCYASRVKLIATFRESFGEPSPCVLARILDCPLMSKEAYERQIISELNGNVFSSGFSENNNIRRFEKEVLQEKSPINKSSLLYDEGQHELAFLVSLKAVLSTPTSSKHVGILTNSIDKIDEKYKLPYSRALKLHYSSRPDEASKNKYTSIHKNTYFELLLKFKKRFFGLFNFKI